MSRGGYRGGGRPRIHLSNDNVDQRIPAQILLTPETDTILRRLSSGIGRSEAVRRLILAAGDTDLAEAVESLQKCIIGSAKDWSVNDRDAWLYAILVGWGDTLGDVAKAHGWDSQTLERLARYREAIVEAHQHE